MAEQSSSIFLIWDGSPLLSGLVWLVLAVLVLYLARTPAHGFLQLLGQRLHQVFRLAARSVSLLERRLAHRNHETLLAWAEDEQERTIEREFRRVHATIHRDLSAYPALHRTLSDQVTRIDEEYRQSTEVPPSPPAWLDAIAAVAQLEVKGDPAVAKILEDMHGTLETACHNALLEYRATSRRRHMGLKRLLPYWRRLSATMEDIRGTLARLEERSRVIDSRMDHYEAIRTRQERAERMLKRSALVRFTAAGVMLALAGLGAVVDFHLLTTPLARVLGASGPIGPWYASDAAAAFLIFWHGLIGLTVAELLGLTHLFGVSAYLDDPLRRRLLGGSIVLLVTLAVLEGGLAYLGARPTGAGLAGSDPLGAWLTTGAQVLLALLLPFALALAAVPLATFAHTGRRVAGGATTVLLRALAALLRLSGQLARTLSALLIRAYDVVICVPLWIEERLRGAPRADAAADDEVEVESGH